MSAIPDVLARQLITAAHMNAVKNSVNKWVTNTDAANYNLSNLGIVSFGANGHVTGNLGIGMVPLGPFSIYSSTNYPPGAGVGQVTLCQSNNSNSRLLLGMDSTTGGGYVQAINADSGVVARSLLLNPTGGSVGVGGITNPLVRLDVLAEQHGGGVRVSGSTYSPMLSFGSVDGTWFGGLGVAFAANQLVTGSATFDMVLRSQSNLLLAAAGAERIRITSVGYVGIGAQSPTSYCHIAGGPAAGSSIADSSPSTLYLQSGGGSSSDGGSVVFGAAQGRFAGIRGVLGNGNGPLGHLLFLTRKSGTDTTLSEIARFTTEGYFGIGCAPNVPLHVAASGGAGNAPGAQFRIGVDSNPLYNMSFCYYPPSGTYVGRIQVVNAGSPSSLLLNPDGGPVGIGCNPLAGQALQVRAAADMNIALRNYGNFASLGVFNDAGTASGQLRLDIVGLGLCTPPVTSVPLAVGGPVDGEAIRLLYSSDPRFYNKITQTYGTAYGGIMGLYVSGLSVTPVPVMTLRGDQRVFYNVATSAVDDASIGGSAYTIWADETNNRLVVRWRTTGGVLKTGYIACS